MTPMALLQASKDGENRRGIFTSRGLRRIDDRSTSRVTCRARNDTCTQCMCSRVKAFRSSGRHRRRRDCRASHASSDVMGS